MQYTDALARTPQGYEATFAVHVVANHLLITELRDRFQAGSRITVTVSDTHFGDLRHNMGMVPAPRRHDPAVPARPGAFPDPATTPARAGRHLADVCNRTRA